MSEDALNDKVICQDWTLYSGVASTSAGVELLKDEIIVIGNAENTTSDLRIGHAVMQDAIDIDALFAAMREAGLEFDGLPPQEELDRIVKCVGQRLGSKLHRNGAGRRNTMQDDSDINHTRSARAWSMQPLPQLHVTRSCMSPGLSIRGPDGGGPISVIAKV